MISLRCTIAAIAVVCLFRLATARAQYAQTTQSSYSQRLSDLQIQNTYQQQQTAAQLAVQQTVMVLQAALHQQTANEPSSFFLPPNFQQQATALQTLLQQTSALQQAQLRSNQISGQTYLLQTSTVQNALQTSTSLANALQVQNGLLTAEQIQLLFQELTSLTGIVGSSPPSIQRSIPRR